MNARGALAAALCLLAAIEARAASAGTEPVPPDVVAVQRLAWDGKLADALAAAERLLAAGRTERALRRVRADCLAWSGRLEPALEDYRALLAERPDDIGVALAIALAHKWQGNLAGVEEELMALAARAPGDREVAAQLQLLRADEHLPLARARAALARTPGDEAVVRTLVDLAVAGEQFREAEDAIAAARRAAPATPGIERLAADLARRKTERLRVRVEERRAALARTPDDLEQRLALAQDLAALERLDEAATEYAIAARAHPERAELRRQEAKLRSWAGDYRRALALYGRLADESPGDGAVRLERARLLAWDGQLAEAVRTLDGLEGAGGAEVQGLLGDVYRWAGVRGRAAQYYRQAVDAGLDGEPGATARSFLASEGDFTTLGPLTEWFTDSDDFQALRGGVETARQVGFTTRLAGQFVHAHYDQHGADLSAERGGLMLTHEWHIFRGLLQAGGNGYSHGTVTPSATAELEVRPLPQHVLGAGYDRYDLIDEVTTLCSATGPPDAHGRCRAGNDVLQGDRARVWFQQVLPLDLQLATTGAYTAITDGNQSLSATAALARRVLRRPRIDVRADVRYYGVGEQSPRYWSPNRYLTTGLGVQIDQPLRWGVHLLLEGRGGYAEEDESSHAEMSWGCGLVYRRPSGWEAGLVYHAGETAREGGYSSELLTARVQYRFGAP